MRAAVNRFEARAHESFSRSTRCAYFTSVDAGTPISKATLPGSSGGDYIGPTATTTTATTTSCRSSHAATTLCLLDDPLTSLDAETRRHVLRHCFHGLMRRNPPVALVISCGEMGGDKGEKSVSANSPAPPILAGVPLGRALCITRRRQYHRVA